jgi:internalin A
MLIGLLRPKFSLRTLLIAMFVAAVGLAWWSQRVRVQQEVCQELTKREIEWEFSQDVPWYGQWLPEFVLKIGEGHWFRHIAVVAYYPHAESKDDDLVLVARLPWLDRLDLYPPEDFDVAKLSAHLLPLGQARGITAIDLESENLGLRFSERYMLNSSMLDSLPAMPQLKRMRIVEAIVTADAASSLNRFPNLEDLDLSDACLDPASMRYLTHLTKLKKLDLADQFIGDNHLAVLREFPSLEKLCLDNNNITDAGLSELALLPTLTELELADNCITDIAPLRPLTKLQKLNLRSTYVSDGALACIGAWPRLTHLTLADTPVTHAALPHLLSAKNLKELDLEECDIGDANAASLMGGLKLEAINISDTWSSSAILAEISRCRTLKKVEIDSVRYPLPEALKLAPPLEIDTGGSDFSRLLGHFNPVFPGTRDISLDLSRFTQVAGNIQPLRGNQILTHLDLTYNEITDADLEVIGTLPNLTQLRVDSPLITDAGLAHLSGLTNLTWLHLDASQVTRDGLRHLTALPKLTHLELFEVDLLDRDVDTWPVLPSVSELKLSRCQLSEECPFPVSAFPNLTTLTCQNSVSAAAFRKLNQLPDLANVTFSQVTEPDDLLKSLEGASKLTTLRLTATELSADSFAVLRRLPSLNIAALRLKSLTTEQLSPLAGHPSLQSLVCTDVPWSVDYLPIAASMPSIVHFRIGGTDLEERHLAVLRGTPRSQSGTLSWNGKYGPLPPLPNRFAIAAKARPVTEIDLVDLTLTTADLGELSRMASLKFVNLSGCELPEGAGTFLAAMPQLQGLDLERVRLSPQLLMDLSHAPNLTTLDLEETKITPEIAAHLVEFSQLKRLDLSRSDIAESEVAKLFAIPHLEDLCLNGTDITDAAFANAKQASRLESLRLVDTKTTYDLVTQLKGHPALTRLQQTGLELDEDDCKYYLRGEASREWQDLELTPGRLAIEAGGGLLRSPFLENLTLNKTARAGELLSLAAKHCPRLDSLKFEDEDLTANDLAQLPLSTRYLHFQNCRFPSDAFGKLPPAAVRLVHVEKSTLSIDLTGLSRLPWLNTVWIQDGSKATSEQIVQLSHCRQLRHVRLHGSNVSKESIVELASNPTIRKIYIDSDQLLSEAKKRIRQNRPWLTDEPPN